MNCSFFKYECLQYEYYHKKISWVDEGSGGMFLNVTISGYPIKVSDQCLRVLFFQEYNLWINFWCIDQFCCNNNAIRTENWTIEFNIFIEICWQTLDIKIEIEIKLKFKFTKTIIQKLQDSWVTEGGGRTSLKRDSVNDVWEGWHVLHDRSERYLNGQHLLSAYLSWYDLGVFQRRQ